MTSTLDLDELLEVVCRQAALALDAGSSYIYEYDAEADAMVWLAEHQSDPSHAFEEPLGTVYPIEDLPQDLAVVRTRRPGRGAPRRPGPRRRDARSSCSSGRRCPRSWCRSSSAARWSASLEVSEAVYPRHFTEQEIGALRRARRAGGGRHPQRPALPPAPGAEGDHRAAGDHRRSHRALQPPLLLGAPARRGRARTPLRPAALAADARPRRLQARQRPLRPPRGRRAAARGGRAPCRRRSGRAWTAPRATAARSSPSSCRPPSPS